MLGGRNTLPTVQLNVLYRMANIMSHLSKEIAQQQVHTAVDLDKICTLQPVHGPRLLYDGLLKFITCNFIGRKVVWIDDYVNQQNGNQNLVLKAVTRHRGCVQ